MPTEQHKANGSKWVNSPRPQRLKPNRFAVGPWEYVNGSKGYEHGLGHESCDMNSRPSKPAPKAPYIWVVSHGICLAHLSSQQISSPGAFKWRLTPAAPSFRSPRTCSEGGWRSATWQHIKTTIAAHPSVVDISSSHLGTATWLPKCRTNQSTANGGSLPRSQVTLKLCARGPPQRLFWQLLMASQRGRRKKKWGLAVARGYCPPKLLSFETLDPRLLNSAANGVWKTFRSFKGRDGARAPAVAKERFFTCILYVAFESNELVPHSEVDPATIKLSHACTATV